MIYSTTRRVRPRIKSVETRLAELKHNLKRNGHIDVLIAHDLKALPQ